MLLAYVDESYTDDWYWIAALICPAEVANPLTAALDGVVIKAAKTFPIHLTYRSELHGYDLFHAKGDWSGVPRRARVAVYTQAMQAIGESGAHLIVRGVDRKRLEARYVDPYHPHSVVLEHLLERIDEHAAGKDEYALVIADEVDDAATHRRNLWLFQHLSTSGYRSRRLTRIVDTMHFAPSHNSRLVQAADLVAFMKRRIKSGVDTDERSIAANDAIWSEVRPCVAHDRCWYP